MQYVDMGVVIHRFVLKSRQILICRRSTAHMHIWLMCHSWLFMQCYRVTLTQVIGLVLLGTHQSSHVE